MTVPILILAGGSSSRMGARHKLLETVHGQPLLRLQAWRALKTSRDVTVLIRPDQPALEHVLEGLPVTILTANEAIEGMGGSLRAGTMAHLRDKCFLMLLADLVEIEANDMRALITARTKNESAAHIWQATTEDGKPGNPILFDRAVYGDLLDLHGDIGARKLLQLHKDELTYVPLPGQRARMDLDTPEDWAAWRATQSQMSAES